MTDSPASDFEETQRAIARERSMNGDSRDLAAELIAERESDQSLEQRLLENTDLLAAVQFDLDHPETLRRRDRSTSPRA